MSDGAEERFATILRGAVGHEAPSLATLCTSVTTLFSVSGTSLVLMSEGATQSVASSLGGLAKSAQDLEFTLGEGPGEHVFRDSEPVCVDDLCAGDGRWPLFADMACQLGIRSIYGLPLRTGSDTIGVLTLCSDRPCSIHGGSYDDALVVAGLVTHQVLALQERNRWEDPAGPFDASDHRAVVHQATGMVSAQLGCGIDEALVRLRGHSFATDVPIDTVAEAVIDRRIRFDEP